MAVVAVAGFTQRSYELSYAFKFMPVIISLLVSIVGGYVIAGILTGFDLSFNVAFWLFFVICAILCAIAIGAITNRGFKKVKGSIINGVVAGALMTLMIICGLYAAEYAEHRVPKADKIETVFVGETELKDNIDLALKLHKGIIECINNDNVQDDYGEFPGVVNNCNNFDFEYVMKNGSVIKRNYWYRSPHMNALNSEILELMQTDSFFEKYEECTNWPIGSTVITVHSHSSKFGTLEDGEGQKNAILTSKEAKYLISLFKKEMQSADMSVFNEKVFGISISGDDWQDLYIPESFTETMSFLEAKFIEYSSMIDKEN